jgi:hypothetical protein
MTNQPNIVSAKAMPPQTIIPLATGATSPMSSAQIQQQQAVQKQMSLIGKTGGSKRRKMKGGTTFIQVPPVQPGTPNYTQNTNTMKQITQVASIQQEQAKFDSQVKKGGSWPVWGCLSGGKRSRCRRIKSRCRRNKSRCRRSRKYRRNIH